MTRRDFLDLREVGRDIFLGLIEDGLRLKGGEMGGDLPLRGKTVACIFMQESTRTRISFHVAVTSLGGNVLMLSERDLQLKKGESLSDTARVMSRYVDAVVLRTNSHEDLLEWSESSDVPLVNAMTVESHPCQLLADMMTCKEQLGRLEGLECAWFGDINNMTKTWVDASGLCGFSLRVVCPEGCEGEEDLLRRAEELGSDVRIEHDVEAGARGADVVVTDTWISMADKDKTEEEKSRVREFYGSYRVDERVMGYAKEGAIFMHCLPMYRGEEVTPEVADGVNSVVWDEAENRLHGQKAVLRYCVGGV